MPNNVEANGKLLTVSALARGFDLDRATVMERLLRAGVKPVSERANEKLYNIEDVEKILSQDELDLEKLRKIKAEADLKELQLAEKRGEYAPVAEFAQLTHDWIGWLYQQSVKKITSQKLLKAIQRTKSEAEARALLKKEVDAVFADFRSNRHKILEQLNAKSSNS